jgi:putative copper export protein
MNPETLAFVYGAVGRWVGYLAVVAIVGATGFAIAIRPASRKGPDDHDVATESRILRLALISALILLGTTAWRLYAQAYSIFGIEEALTWEHVRIVVFDTAWGGGWLWQFSAALLAAVATAGSLRVPRAGRALVIAAALVVVVVVPLTGHATSREGAVWLSAAVQVLHVGGVGLWIGTLLIVMTLLRPSSDDKFVAAVRAFSPLAVAAVTTIVASGLLTAIIYLDSFSDLWSGAYGRTLVLKLVLFTAVAALGAYNWRRLRPLLDQPGPVRTLNRTARVELIIAGLTLAVTAVLVALPLVHD